MRIGGDLRFSTDKVLVARNFANKIWNAARFVLMNTGDTVLPIDENRLDNADKWMLSRLTDMTEDITSLIDKYELGLAAQKLHDFLWSELCDWYIEMAKPRLSGEDEADKQTAVSVLNHAGDHDDCCTVHAVYHRGDISNASGHRRQHHGIVLAGTGKRYGRKRR